VLDVGYLESEIIYQLASLGFEAWGIDIRPAAAEFPGVRFIQGDVIKYPFEPHSFDAVIALSTVEHIGLHAYGNVDADPEGDRHALQAIHRALKPSGRLILTVPFGKRGVAEWQRVYDYGALQALLRGSGFRVEAEDFWTKHDYVRWVPTPWKEAEQVDSVTGGVMAVAGVVARPVSASSAPLR
jgi:SAM-dependent methyltransferase